MRSAPTLPVVLLALLLAAVTGLGIGALAGVDLDRTGTASSPPPTASATAGPTPTGEPAAGLTLESDVAAADRMGSITLSGRLTPPEEGVALQVQRQEGEGWDDFPVTTTTGSDGAFSVVVKSGRTGVNVFRVVDAERTDVASEPVSVEVG